MFQVGKMHLFRSPVKVCHIRGTSRIHWHGSGGARLITGTSPGEWDARLGKAGDVPMSQASHRYMSLQPEGVENHGLSWSPRVGRSPPFQHEIQILLQPWSLSLEMRGFDFEALPEPLD